MLTVLIPTFNERENIEELVARLMQLSQGFRVLIVDDKSPEGTGKIPDKLAQEFAPYVDVLHR